MEILLKDFRTSQRTTGQRECKRTVTQKPHSSSRQRGSQVLSPLHPLSRNLRKTHTLPFLPGVGATLPKRDTLDRRVVREAKTGIATYEGSAYAAINGTGISHPSGIIDTPSDAKGLPAYNSTFAPPDSDHDGMPDAVGNCGGLNPNNASDRNVLGSDGYTNLEKYLNSITKDVGITTGLSSEISNHNELTDFSISPNPGNGREAINHPDLTEEVLVTFYDLTGMKINSTVISPGEKVANLDLSNLANGLYIAVFDYKGGRFRTRFIKQ